jgi:hypothetical protein
MTPGEKRQVQVRVVCPKDLKGETMGMVSFSYTGASTEMITPMISVSVYLRAEGTERNEGQIVDLGAGIRDRRILIAAQVKATGNVRLRPSGRIRLAKEDGEMIADYSISEGNPIFPGEKKDLWGTPAAAIGARLLLDPMWTLRQWNVEWKKSQWGNPAAASSRFAADLGE